MHSAQHEQTERGVHGIFVWFPENQKGFLVYILSVCATCISGDVLFDEHFSSAVAHTWRQFHDSLALVPKQSLISFPDLPISQTGSIENQLYKVEVGKFKRGGDNRDSDDASELSMADQTAWEADHENPNYCTEPEEVLFPEGPQVMDNSANVPRRSSRQTKATARLTMDHSEAAKSWQEAKFCDDVELAAAFTVETSVTIDASGADASLLEPTLDNLRVIMKMKDPRIKEAWLKAYHKELRVLILQVHFQLKPMLPGEVAVPTMETNQVKLQSDSTLDKLKISRLSRTNGPPLLLSGR